MDIQHLLQRLEDVIEAGRHMPFSRYTLIDEVRALELIDQLRISIPEEVEKAKRILMRREEILGEAHEEGERVIGQARNRGTEIVEREVTVQVAQNRANLILEEARREASQLRADADAYVIQILNKLEQGLARNLSITRNGIQYMNRTLPVGTQQGDASAAPVPALRRVRRNAPLSEEPAATAEKELVEASPFSPPEDMVRG